MTAVSPNVIRGEPPPLKSSWRLVAAAALQPRVLAAVLAVAFAGAAAFVLRFPPSRSSFYPKCAFHSVTSLHCAGCGSSRALHSLLHGRVAEAFGYNGLAVLLLPFVAVQMAYQGYSALRFNRWREIRVRPCVSTGIVVAVFAFAVLRNLPAAPFSCLAP